MEFTFIFNQKSKIYFERYVCFYSSILKFYLKTYLYFDFYNLWEELHNENFNSVESHRIKIDEVRYNRFTMTPNRWKKEFKLYLIMVIKKPSYNILS